MRNRLSFLALILLLASCSEVDYEARESPPRNDSIDLSEVAVALPEGEGKEIIERSCVPCHSLRYIEMQPPMPRKNWDKTVKKMITAYGAPVRDSAEAARIVDYLVQIRGTDRKSGPAQP